MANRENRVKKLEEKTPKGRWVYPIGYYYNEPDSEPYWTDEPVKPFSAWGIRILKKKSNPMNREANSK